MVNVSSEGGGGWWGDGGVSGLTPGARERAEERRSAAEVHVWGPILDVCSR